mmetsp:Transcript_87493/g.267689  ORF Transcript_87493/g.267689 Transcript_87493/m.267689 type:complete len:105 (-) Transcript_87493:121-435(-)
MEALGKAKSSDAIQLLAVVAMPVKKYNQAQMPFQSRVVAEKSQGRAQSQFERAHDAQARHLFEERASLPERKAGTTWQFGRGESPLEERMAMGQVQSVAVSQGR